MRTTSGRRASSAEMEGMATAARRPVEGNDQVLGQADDWRGRTVDEGFGKVVYSRFEIY